MFTDLKSLTTPEGIVKKIMSNGIVLWEEPPSIKNWALCSLESGGNSIYNSGKGYKTGYRVRSGGAEASSGSDSIITGFIPFKKGDVLRIYPPFDGGNTWNCINFADSSFTNLGQTTDSGARYGICTTAYKSSVINGVSTLTYTDSIDNSVAYVRITNRFTSSPDELIITVNEEIPI